MTLDAYDIEIQKNYNRNPIIPSIWLPSELANISQGQITASFGSAQCRIHAQIDPSLHRSLRFNKEAMRRLGVVPGLRLTVRWNEAKKHIRIGPLIGLVLAIEAKSLIQSQSSPLVDFCKETCIAATKNGIVGCVIPLAQLRPFKNLRNRKVNAYLWNGQSWHHRLLPLPTVLYNRLATTKQENGTIFRNLKKWLKHHPNHVMFNERFLDKSEVFEALKHTSILGKHLPKTTEYDEQALFSYLHQFNNVFIKPIHGRLGRGILFLEKIPNGQVNGQHSTISNAIRNASFPEVSTWANKIIGHRSYQIQQGVSLIRLGRRIVDFRLLVHKDHRGQWRLVSSVGRIASAAKGVSNVAQGGEIESVRKVLQQAKFERNQCKEIALSMKRVALAAAESLDDFYSGTFGEFGVDLALDGNANVWILEINSKPSKTQGTTHEPGSIRPSVRAAVSYAAYLAGVIKK